MDIVLERILSLIPRKPDGKFVHGAKKAFAVSIGYDSGDIISMWVKGTSSSYMGKLHEIAMKYNVSVEWLKGETDDPTPLTGEGQKNIPLPDGREREDEVTKELRDIWDKADDDERAAILEVARLMKKRRAK